MKRKILFCLLITVFGLSGCSKVSDRQNVTNADDFVEIVSEEKESDEVIVDASAIESEETSPTPSPSASNKTNQNSQTSQQHTTNQESSKKETTNNQTNESVNKSSVIPVPKLKPTPTPTLEVKPDPTPTPKPVEPEICKQCIHKDLPCDAIIDNTVYREVFSSQGEADSRGYYYLNDVCELNGMEITNYSVQPIYNNHGEAVSYGLELWSNGTLIE